MEEAVQTGKVLGGRYTLGERLGAGGWGSVYAAVHNGLGRPVAIKVLHTSVALAPDGLVRFEREAKAAAALGHPNIAQVSDFQANAGEPPFLVMELLTGKTLGATMRASQKIAPTRMAWIAYQILAGLDVAHRAGIVHRDIKPDNVFLVAMPGVEDYVKLLDFGIAKLAGEANSHLTTTGTMLGSPAFMAPEQVRGNDVDHRVDLYALGATMYLALSGRMPFDATNVHALLLAITEQRPLPLRVVDPSIDAALSVLVERAMHKDPNGRFASAEEMRGALEPWLGGMAAHASSTAKAQRMSSPAAAMTGAMPGAPMMVQGSPPTMAGPPHGTPPPATTAMSPHGTTPPPHGAPPYGAAPTPPYGAPPAPQHSAPPAPPFTPHQGSHPSYSGSAPAQSQYVAAPAHASSMTPAPAPPASRAKSGGAVIGLLVAAVVLLLVIVGGGIAGLAYYGGTGAAASASAARPATPPGSAAATAAGAAPAAPAGATGAARAAAPGAAAAAKPGTKAASNPAVAPGPAAAAGSPAAAPSAVAVVADAGALAAKKQFASSGFTVSGGSFGPYTADAVKAAINARGGAIAPCYAATEFDPPDHQFTDWIFQIDPAGNVTSVRRATDFQLHPKFDNCMKNALRTVKWPVTPSGGSPQVSFNSRTRDNP